jgi:hypothetical protein
MHPIWLRTFANQGEDPPRGKIKEIRIFRARPHPIQGRKNMKKNLLLFFLLALAGCAGTPSPTAAPSLVIVRAVSGDRLPDEFPRYAVVDLAQRSQWQEVDALLISKDLLYQARDDASLRQQLQDAARRTVLLISGATTQDAAQILQLGSPTVTTTTTEYVLVSIRATNTQIFGGGILVYKDRKVEPDLARDINDYVRLIQKHVE